MRSSLTADLRDDISYALRGLGRSRMALGAERGAVLRMVLRRGIVLAAIGIVVGLAGAAGLTRYLSGMLYDLTPLDPPTYAVVAILFAIVALIAAYLPARRPTQVDPVVALKHD